jgi:predicted transposase/invertase (TIGR01784 family)
MREDETNEILTDIEEIHFIEILKLKEYREDSPVTWWVEFIRNPHSEIVKKIGEFEPVIKEAVKMFDIVRSDPTTQELMRIMNDGECDYNSAICEAETKGRMEEKREMVQNLLRNKVDINAIASSSGLSVSEIEKLR